MILPYHYCWSEFLFNEHGKKKQFDLHNEEIPFPPLSKQNEIRSSVDKK